LDAPQLDPREELSYVVVPTLFLKFPRQLTTVAVRWLVLRLSYYRRESSLTFLREEA
jgi:hypothetical protein